MSILGKISTMLGIASAGITAMSSTPRGVDSHYKQMTREEALKKHKSKKAQKAAKKARRRNRR